MAKVIGVRFRSAGKVYYFDPLDFELRHGDMVVVETAMGNECGRVVLSAREVPDEKVTKPLRPVVRKADEQDIRREEELRKKENEAFHICKNKIREHNLDMKLVAAECTFDGKKIMFYFTADGRVDFRELVRDLASVFNMRIELRQIGVRDETRILGGIGICGRQLCCSSYLTDFVPVSIRMAKEQNLSLNPGKISGVCGRLMCCLKNEEETYEYLNRNLPGIGDTVQTPDERVGVVSAVNVLRQQIRVLIEEGDEKDMEEYPAADLTLIAKKKKGPRQQPKKKAQNDEAAEGGSGEKKKGRNAGKSEGGKDGRGAEKAGDRENGREADKSGRKESDRNRERTQGESAGGKNAEESQGRTGRGRNRRRRQNAQNDASAGSGNAMDRESGSAPGARTERDNDVSASEELGEEKKHRSRRRRRHRNNGGNAAGASGDTAGESEGGTAQ